MVEIKRSYLYVILGVMLIFGILLMGNFVLYFSGEQYPNGFMALINVFLAIIIAEILVIRPIEWIIRLGKKSEPNSIK